MLHAAMASQTSVYDFMKKYVPPCAKVRYFTKSQLFVAYRCFLARTRPTEIINMDFDIFVIEFQEAIKNLAIPTKTHGRTTYYKLYVGGQGEHIDMLDQKKTDTHRDDDKIKLKLDETNIFICCKLCCGYLVEATTITECLHSFCKSCIVKHLHTNKFCPVCGVAVSQRNPLSSLKLDQALQDIVNIILPGNEINEQIRSNAFKIDQNTNIDGITPPYFISTLYLEWIGIEKSTLPSKDLLFQYIKTSSKATIAHIAQFISCKLGKLDNEGNPTVKCAISCGEIELPYILTLENIFENNLDFLFKNGALYLQYDLQPLKMVKPTA